ncbi:MAG: hypothetical protein NVSMB31_10900 [Vulcanimicrobiaceae bacterium]
MEGDVRWGLHEAPAAGADARIDPSRRTARRLRYKALLGANLSYCYCRQKEEPLQAAALKA